VNDLTQRLFLAVPLSHLFPDEFQSILQTLKKSLEGIKWVSAEQAHLTLHFFGETPEREIPKIKSILSVCSSRHCAFSLGLGKLGVFPETGKPKVICIGLTGEIVKLNALQGEYLRNLKSAGYFIEERPFKAHATLGRIKTLTKLPLTDFHFTDTHPRKVSQVILFQSTLTPQGPHYETLETFALPS